MPSLQLSPHPFHFIIYPLTPAPIVLTISAAPPPLLPGRRGRRFDARISGVRGDEVLVHYMGWTHKWDTWVLRASPEVQPLHSHTADWRSSLAAGGLVEVRVMRGGTGTPR